MRRSADCLYKRVGICWNFTELDGRFVKSKGIRPLECFILLKHLREEGRLIGGVLMGVRPLGLHCEKRSLTGKKSYYYMRQKNHLKNGGEGGHRIVMKKKISQVGCLSTILGVQTYFFRDSKEMFCGNYARCE